MRVQIGQDELDRLIARAIRDRAASISDGVSGRRELRVQDLLDKGSRAAATGAEVNEDVVVDRSAEVRVEDRREEVGGGGFLEERDLDQERSQSIGASSCRGGAGMGRTVVVQASVRAAWTRARNQAGNLGAGDGISGMS